ncbi:hypothetical protein [Tianweitania sp.]|uniref:hypothetical protein n=1 Tax=Tianweitania sp. TaxID=2021634 RepID=UPI00289C2A03|nr:hypothetical protein [Tianweitania sp.]
MHALTKRIAPSANRLCMIRTRHCRRPTKKGRIAAPPQEPIANNFRVQPAEAITDPDSAPMISQLKAIITINPRTALTVRPQQDFCS